MRVNAAIIALILGMLTPGSSSLAQPLDTSFTYQGSLTAAGVPATGLYDLRFRLYSAASGGAQVGPALCADNVAMADGRFVVRLDFGAQFAGQQRFLELDVRQDSGLGCGNGAGFTTLTTRQALTATPNAAYALTATNATNAATAASATTATTATNATQLNGQAASFYQNAANLTTGAIPDARLVGTYTGAVNFSNAGNTLTGNGAGLANVNANQLGGQPLSAFGRLATGQTWTAANTFSNASNAFTGSGSGLTGVNAAQLGGQLPAAFGRIAGTQTWSGINDFNNPGNFFEGTFIGNGASVTNVNAAQLGGLTSAAFGQLNGNQLWIGANSFVSNANSFTGLGVGLTRVNAELLNGLHSSQFLREVPNPLSLAGIAQFGDAILMVENQAGINTSSAIVAKLTGAGNDQARAISAYANATGVNPTYGVYASQSGNGVAVYGQSSTVLSTGVRGESNQGTGVYAISNSGKALRVDGRSLFNANVEFASGVNLSLGAGTNASFPIQLDNSLGEKISLFGINQFNHYGFGVQSGTLQIFTDVPASGVAIGSGGSSTFVETIRFVGSEIQFRLDNVDVISKIDMPYDMTFGMDRNANNNNSWYRFYTNGRLFEQFRIVDDDEAAAFFDGAVNANGIDYAEAFKTLDPTLEPGDVVVVGQAGDWQHVSRSDRAYDSAAIGVVSTKPAFVAGMSFNAEDAMDPELTKRRDAARAAGDEELEKTLTMQMRALVKQAYRPVAFMGRVPVKVTGPVNVGDHLTTSAVAGHAMSMDRAGHSIGIALEASDGGERKIMVLVQPKYFAPDAEIPSDAADTIGQVLAQFNRVLAENADLKARLERLEAAPAPR